MEFKCVSILCLALGYISTQDIAEASTLPLEQTVKVSETNGSPLAESVAEIPEAIKEKVAEVAREAIAEKEPGNVAKAVKALKVRAAYAGENPEKISEAVKALVPEVSPVKTTPESEKHVNIIPVGEADVHPAVENPAEEEHAQILPVSKPLSEEKAAVEKPLEDVHRLPVQESAIEENKGQVNALHAGEADLQPAVENHEREEPVHILPVNEPFSDEKPTEVPVVENRECDSGSNEGEDEDVEEDDEDYNEEDEDDDEDEDEGEDEDGYEEDEQEEADEINEHVESEV